MSSGFKARGASVSFTLCMAHGREKKKVRCQRAKLSWAKSKGFIESDVQWFV